MMLEQGPYTLMALGALAGLAVGVVIALLWRARLKGQLRDQSMLEQERAAALNLASEKLSNVFNRLADEQFRSHAETFLKLAHESLGTHHERAKGDLAAREQAIEGLLRPVRDAIERTERQLQALEKVRSETHGSITKHLQDIAAGQQQLNAETRNLVTALRRPEVRGQWGELTLRRLVELAGMLEHCDFVTQSHVPTPEGAVRPDLVVFLPEGRQLVVDVKTPIDAYLEAIDAPSDVARRSALTRHAGIVAGRVRELAAKAYWTQFEAAPDFVILFIPGDQFLTAALAERPELLDDALRQNVILATPTSLVALLKAIAYGWQQVKLGESAAQIRELAVELHSRLGTFTEHLDAIGKALSEGVRAYNASVGSLERRVLPSARRFTELGVQPRRELAELKVVEEIPREGALLGEDTDDAADDSLGTPAEPSGPH
jgi:DNA recombination protein RmuC